MLGRELRGLSFFPSFFPASNCSVAFCFSAVDKWIPRPTRTLTAYHKAVNGSGPPGMWIQTVKKKKHDQNHCL